MASKKSVPFGRGGPRLGAGRPPRGKVRINLTLTGSLVTRARSREHNLSALMDRLLIQWLPAPGMPQGRGVEKTPGVCGGSARIARTRIPVWVLEGLRRQGASEAELLVAYPTLSANDLVTAWAYVVAHRKEIDAEISANDAV